MVHIFNFQITLNVAIFGKNHSDKSCHWSPFIRCTLSLPHDENDRTHLFLTVEIEGRENFTFESNPISQIQLLRSPEVHTFDSQITFKVAFFGKNHSDKSCVVIRAIYLVSFNVNS